MNRNIISGLDDSYVRDDIAGKARRLSPVPGTDGQLAYASLLLAWVLRGESPDDRCARRLSICQAYDRHTKDCLNKPRDLGVALDQTIPFPDFMIEVEKFYAFVGGETS